MTSLSVALGSNSRLPGYNYSVLGVDFWEWQGEAASCVLWMIPSSNPAEYSTACMAGDILDRCMIWEAFHLGYPFGGLTFGLYSYSRPEVDRIWMNMIYIEYGFFKYRHFREDFFEFSHPGFSHVFCKDLRRYWTSWAAQRAVCWLWNRKASSMKCTTASRWASVPSAPPLFFLENGRPGTLS